MTTFTIDGDNNATVYSSAEEAAQAGDLTTISFDSQAALAKLSDEWPMSRFVDIWSSISGQSPVKKFQDRKSAVSRIWKAIQPLAGEGYKNQAEPEAEKPKRIRKQAKPTAKEAKKADGSKKTAGKPKTDRSNKKADVIAMMNRAKGVTLAEIMEVTGWQKHTVRGFVSILGSKGGLSVKSEKNPAGERTYRIAK